METTVFNPQKGRYETIEIEFTEENTTWLDNCTAHGEIHMITDWNGDLIMKEFGYTYPFLIYDRTRAEIDDDQQKALEVLRNKVEGYDSQ